MKKLMICLGLLFVLLPALAERAALDGVFGHQFTGKPNDPVWTIKSQGGVITLLTHGDNSKTVLRELSAKDRQSFWKKMMWPEQTSVSATCVGNAEDLFCVVPLEAKRKIDWLKNNKSDYFYFSQMGGVMEVTRIGPQ